MKFSINLTENTNEWGKMLIIERYGETLLIFYSLHPILLGLFLKFNFWENIILCIVFYIKRYKFPKLSHNLNFSEREVLIFSIK